MDRIALTPGKLYARLSAEFRNHPSRHCQACRMPMVVPRRSAGEDQPNWSVEETPPVCEECRPIIRAVVESVGRRYALHDPAATLKPPQPPPTWAASSAASRP